MAPRVGKTDRVCRPADSGGYRVAITTRTDFELFGHAGSP